MHAERIALAYELRDAGKYEEALAAFETAYASDHQDAPMALIGVADVYEAMKDNPSRLATVVRSFETNNRFVVLGMMIYHYLPVMWPGKDEVDKDAIEAIKKQAALLYKLAGFLPHDAIDHNFDVAATEILSDNASDVLFMHDARVAEVQIHASLLLGFEPVLKLQLKAMKNLFFFLRANPPARIGAVMAMNNMTSQWKHFDLALDQLVKCEKAIAENSSSPMSEDALRAVDSEFDQLMAAGNYNFYDAFINFGTILDQIIYGKVNQDSDFIKQLHDKYR